MLSSQIVASFFFTLFPNIVFQRFYFSAAALCVAVAKCLVLRTRTRELLSPFLIIVSTINGWELHVHAYWGLNHHHDHNWITTICSKEKACEIRLFHSEISLSFDICIMYRICTHSDARTNHRCIRLLNEEISSVTERAQQPLHWRENFPHWSTTKLPEHQWFWKESRLWVSIVS